MANNLVTLAEYKSYVGINNDGQDSEINSIIPKVSNLVKNICKRSFVDFITETKIETFSGGYNKLLLKESPVLSILDVEYSTNFGQTYTALVEFTDYVLDEEDNTIVSTAIDSEGNSVPFTKYINGYRVYYTAGYETLPEDLKLAVLDLITYYLKHESAIHSTKAPGTNSVQIEYITNTKLPAHISRILDLYTASYD